MTDTDSRILSADHARESGVDKPWEGSNEAWWDWYLSLATDEGGAPTELVELAPEPAAPKRLTLAELEAELAEPYALTPEQVEAFRADGYAKVRGVFSAGAIELAREAVDELAAAGDGPGASGFLSMDMMWQGDSEVLRLFALSPRLGRLAADLLAVADVRMYHDNVLSKTPGCGRTPWHFDAHHFPIASRDIVTSWLPLQALPLEMGPLAFARGAETWRVADGVDFAAQGDSYDAGVSKAFAQGGVEVDDTPFALGDVSFHHAWCFHYARGNGTTQPRRVLANTYFADGAKLVDEPTMVSGDYEKFLPGAKPGERIDTPLNPVVSATGGR